MFRARFHWQGVVLSCTLTMIACLLMSPAILRADESVDSSSVSREQIIKAWADREKKVTSAQFEWTEVRSTTGLFLLPDESIVEPDVPQYKVKSSLSLKGTQLRHTFRKSTWQKDAPRGENQYVSVSNGKTSKIYLPPGYVSEYPRGHASQIASSDETSSAYLKPFLWSFRTSLPRVFAAPVEKFQLKPERVLSQGIECVVMCYEASPTNSFELWADPSRDFLIVRQLFLNDGRVGNQLDIDYQQDEKTQLWIPQEWKFSLLDGSGQPILSVHGELTRAVINPNLPDSQFEYEFPPGTWVHEDGSREHIVLADGRQREVPVGDRDLPYETLLSDSAPHPVNGWKAMFVRINVMVFLSASVSLIVHRYYSRPNAKVT